MISMLGNFHRSHIAEGRCNALSVHLTNYLPVNSCVLDIGAGSGQLSLALKTMRPDLNISCIDTIARKDAAVPIDPFDGEKIPREDDSFDFSMLIDVLHHAKQPEKLLSEAARVARHGVIIKDHTNNSLVDKTILSFMDYIGNRPYGVEILYNYLSLEQWDQLFDKTSLKQMSPIKNIRIYPFPFNYLFDRNMHMICMVSKNGKYT